ncbi:MAG: DUF4373 domain-containing protein [Anaerofustis stercorihominis]|nr:DUF4373 domain-containing protein [Anaerofustis stercorihominis]
MARPQKKGLDYFPMDVDFYDDIKLTVLTGKFGSDALAVYVYILCRIFKNWYYIEFSEDLVYSVARYTGVDADKVEDIILTCAEKDLFDMDILEEYDVLTSRYIQSIYQEAVKTRGKKNPVTVDECWILTEEETASYIISPYFSGSYENNNDYSANNEDNSRNNTTKESKEKEIKEKENKQKEREYTDIDTETETSERELSPAHGADHVSFRAPSLEEVKKYADDNELYYVSTERFHDYYTRHKWKNITDWQEKLIEWNDDAKNSHDKMWNINQKPDPEAEKRLRAVEKVLRSISY